MKIKQFYWPFFCILLLLSSCSDTKRKLPGETDFQKALNASFIDATKSPLKDRDRKNFKALPFYPYDTSYKVEASIKKESNASYFTIQNSKGDASTKLYKKYGSLSFTLKGKDCSLLIFEYVGENETDKQTLFLPFTDLTTGNGSYATGRYMDVEFPNNGDNKVLLDFNNTYNPYCAYNDNYSCPIPPRENHLDLAVEAGIQK